MAPFAMEGDWVLVSQGGGVGKEQALQVLAPLVGRVVAQANPGLPETPALLSAS